MTNKEQIQRDIAVAFDVPKPAGICFLMLPYFLPEILSSPST